MRREKNMRNFYGDISTQKSEHLLKATPYTKEPIDNFAYMLDKKTFFQNFILKDLKILNINPRMICSIRK